MGEIEHTIVRAAFIRFRYLMLGLTAVEFEDGYVLHLIKESILRSRQDPPN